jgi:two-component system, chemotaxis family, sensor kinase CheA
MDDRLLGIFRAEAGDRLDEMVQTLLAVETGEGDAEAIRGLFRHAHSLKGTAGMVGLDAIGVAAGAIEDVLAQAREAGTLDRALVAPLLAVTDAIRAAMDGAPLDGEAIAAQLAAVEGMAVAPSAVTPGSAPSAPMPTPMAPAVRTPTLRVAAERVDDLLDVAGQAVVGIRRFEELAGPDVDHRVREELEHGEALMLSLQDSVLRLRTLPLSSIVGPFPRAVRDIAVHEGKEVELELVDVDAQLDRVILDGLPDLIVHLLRNAVSHGIEPPDQREAAGKDRVGRIVLRAETAGGGVRIHVSDDGRGIPRELQERAPTPVALAELLSTPGLTTADRVSELSGRGVGLDAVRRAAEALGGGLLASGEPGKGSAFTLRMPTTLAVLGLLLVARADQVFGLPLVSLEEVLDDELIVALPGRDAIDVRGEVVALADLGDVLGMDAAPARGPVLVVNVLNRRVAVRVDALIGEQEAMVRSLGSVLAAVPGYLGATLLSDGTISLIVDPRHVARSVVEAVASAPQPPVPPAPAGERAPRAVGSRVLVVGDRPDGLAQCRTILADAGYDVLTAHDGRQALDALEREHDVRLVLADAELPLLDGSSLLGRLRDDPRHGALPVVVLSSRGEDGEHPPGVRADAYVDATAVDARALLEVVQRLVVG